MKAQTKTKKVYSRLGKLLMCLREDELWTTDLRHGKKFPEKEANGLVSDFKCLAKDFKIKRSYWCR